MDNDATLQPARRILGRRPVLAALAALVFALGVIGMPLALGADGGHDGGCGGPAGVQPLTAARTGGTGAAV